MAMATKTLKLLPLPHYIIEYALKLHSGTASVLLDISILSNMLGNESAQGTIKRVAIISARAGRLSRMVRLLRLVRTLKLVALVFRVQ